MNHYRQAVDLLVAHRYEAANGALRSALDDLVTRLVIYHEACCYYVQLGPALLDLT